VHTHECTRNEHETAHAHTLAPALVLARDTHKKRETNLAERVRRVERELLAHLQQTTYVGRST
jgi:hypothetical protein